MLGARVIKFSKMEGTAPVSIQAQGVGVEMLLHALVQSRRLRVACRALGPIVVGSAVVRVNPHHSSYTYSSPMPAHMLGRGKEAFLLEDLAPPEHEVDGPPKLGRQNRERLFLAVL